MANQGTRGPGHSDRFREGHVTPVGPMRAFPEIFLDPWWGKCLPCGLLSAVSRQVWKLPMDRVAGAQGIPEEGSQGTGTQG